MLKPSTLLLALVASIATAAPISIAPKPEEVTNRLNDSELVLPGYPGYGTYKKHGGNNGAGIGTPGCVFDGSASGVKSEKANEKIQAYFLPKETYKIRKLSSDETLTVTNDYDEMALHTPYHHTLYTEAGDPQVYALELDRVPVIDSAYSASWPGGATPYNYEANKKTVAVDPYSNYKVTASNRYYFLERIYYERMTQWFFDHYVPRGGKFSAKPTHADFRKPATNERKDSYSECIAKIDDITQNIVDQYMGLRDAVLRRIGKDNSCTMNERYALWWYWYPSVGGYDLYYRLYYRVYYFTYYFAYPVICSGSDEAVLDAAYGETRAKATASNVFHPLLWGIVDVFKPGYPGYASGGLRTLNDYPLVDSAYYGRYQSSKPRSKLNTYYHYYVNP